MRKEIQVENQFDPTHQMCPFKDQRSPMQILPEIVFLPATFAISFGRRSSKEERREMRGLRQKLQHGHVADHAPEGRSFEAEKPAVSAVSARFCQSHSVEDSLQRRSFEGEAVQMSFVSTQLWL